MDENALIAAYEPLVRRLAGKYIRRGRGEVLADFDDLVQVGLLAVLEAAAVYDATKGASLATWINKRVMFTFGDYMREADPLSRSHRQQVNAGVRPQITVRSIHDAWIDRNGSSDSMELPTGARPHEESLENRDLLEWLARGLRPQAKRVLLLRLEGKTQWQIAAILGISSSRVSQLETKAFAHLRQRAREA